MQKVNSSPVSSSENLKPLQFGPRSGLVFCQTLKVFLIEFFENVTFEEKEISRRQKITQNFPVCKSSNIFGIVPYLAE